MHFSGWICRAIEYSQLYHIMPNWFPKLFGQCTHPGHYVRVPVAPHIYQHLMLSTVRVLFFFCQSSGCGFICISLMSIEGEHLFMCLLAIWISFLAKWGLKLLPSVWLDSHCLLDFFLGNNIIHRINGPNKKNRMIVSIDAENTFDKIKH